MKRTAMVLLMAACMVLAAGCEKEKDSEPQAAVPAPVPGPNPGTDTIPDPGPGVDTIPAPDPETQAERIHRWLYGTWELQQERWFYYFTDTTHYEEFPLLIEEQYIWRVASRICKRCTVSDEPETVTFSDSTVLFSRGGGYWNPYDIEEDGVVVIDRGTEYRYRRAYEYSLEGDYRVHGVRVYVPDSTEMLMYNYIPMLTGDDTADYRQYPCVYRFVKLPREIPAPCPDGMGCL